MLVEGVISALGRVSSTSSSTTLLISTSASGEVAGAFIRVRTVGRKLSSTTSWWTLIDTKIHYSLVHIAWLITSPRQVAVLITEVCSLYACVTCSRGHRAGRRRQGSAAAACRPQWQDCTTAAPDGRASWHWRFGRCTWVWPGPPLSPCAGLTPEHVEHTDDSIKLSSPVSLRKLHAYFYSMAWLFHPQPLTSLSRNSESITSILCALSSGASPLSSITGVSSSCLSGDWEGGAVWLAATSESSWKPNSSSRSMMARRALIRIFTSSSWAIWK